MTPLTKEWDTTDYDLVIWEFVEFEGLGPFKGLTHFLSRARMKVFK
jgi:hypothetical protein